ARDVSTSMSRSRPGRHGCAGGRSRHREFTHGNWHLDILRARALLRSRFSKSPFSSPARLKPSRSVEWFTRSAEAFVLRSRETQLRLIDCGVGVRRAVVAPACFEARGRRRASIRGGTPSRVGRRTWFFEEI